MPGSMRQVDACFDGVAVNVGQLIGGKIEVVEGGDALLELGRAAGTDQGDVTRGSRTAQAMANWARDWPRSRATSLSAWTRARLASLSIP
jgi:hypothetical protein